MGEPGNEAAVTLEQRAAELHASLAVPATAKRFRELEPFAVSLVHYFCIIGQASMEPTRAANGHIEVPAVQLLRMCGSACKGLRLQYPSASKLRGADPMLEISQSLEIDKVGSIYVATAPEIGSFSANADRNLPADQDELRRYVFDFVARQLFEPTRAAANDACDLGESVPSLEEFAEAAGLLASCGFEFAEPLDSILFSAVPFGARGEDDGSVTFPIDRHLVQVWNFASRLARQSGSGSPNQPSAVAGALALRVAWELTVLAWTIETCGKLHAALEPDELPEGSETALVALMTAAAEPGLGGRRAIAAEYAGYLLDRSHPGTDQDALMAAAAHFRFAYEHTCNSRLAKYLANDMIGLGRLRDDPFAIAIAESVWIDHYIFPHLRVMIGLDARKVFEPISSGAQASITHAAIQFDEIPAYSADPMFLYTGRAAQHLAAGPSNFAADLWAAGVLLVQRYKDEASNKLLSDIERSSGLVDLTGDEPQFPMRELHPIAWLYYAAERLLQADRDGAIHAGLTSPLSEMWKERNRLAAHLREFEVRMQPDAERVDQIAAREGFKVSNYATLEIFVPLQEDEMWQQLAIAWYTP